MQARKYLILVGLLKKTDFNAKIIEIEGKILSINGFAINAALTAVENEIPDITNLIKKKQIKMQKYQKLKMNILLLLITINLLKILLLIA